MSVVPDDTSELGSDNAVTSPTVRPSRVAGVGDTMTRQTCRQWEHPLPHMAVSSRGQPRE